MSLQKNMLVAAMIAAGAAFNEKQAQEMIVNNAHNSGRRGWGNKKGSAAEHKRAAKKLRVARARSKK